MDFLVVCLTFYACAGLGEAVLMRWPPLGEEETPRLSKDRKRKKEMLAESPKPKRAKAQKPRADATVLTSAAAENLRAEDKDDDGYPLVQRAKRSIDASKVTMMYDQDFSKLRAELTHSEEELEKLAMELKELKTLYAQKEEELNSHRASSEKCSKSGPTSLSREISKEAELKLASTLAHAWLKAQRKAFEEVHAKGFDLSAEIEEEKALEEESTTLTSSDEGSTILSLSYTNFLVGGIGEFSEVRLSPFEEEEGPSISEARKDNKRKRSSKDEDSHSKAGSARGCEEEVAADEDLIFIGRSVDINAPREDDSILMARTSRPSKIVEPAELEAHSLEGEIPQARKGEGPSVPDFAPGFQTSGWASTYLCPIGAPRAFDKLKSGLLCCEAKLHKALNGEKSLRLLCDKKTREPIHLRSELDRSRNYEGNLEKQAQIDVHVADKRNALDKASTLEIQLSKAPEGDSIQMSRIAKLEIELLKIKAEVVDARAEAEEVRAKADKKVVIYLKYDVIARRQVPHFRC
ncbi:MAR-binding filament-like protein 1-1 [Nicotiana sylvestris]|uniref:MAR-binding filament-like protein 1-1 n=1 Tax=Nicotiana sylvestris TaxID=4096 RepID=UPI00388C99E6